MGEGELQKRIKEMPECTNIPRFLDVLEEAKTEIKHAIYSGGDLELRKVLHKWFGRFDE